MGEIKRQRGETQRQRDIWEKQKDREIEGRDIETEKQRDRADNKNPKQSWVAQLVFNRNDPTFKLGFLIEYYENQIYLEMVKLTARNCD